MSRPGREAAEDEADEPSSAHGGSVLDQDPNLPSPVDASDDAPGEDTKRQTEDYPPEIDDFASREKRHRRRAAFILVGGASRRMGRDKALMEWEGRPLAVHLAEQAASIAGTVFLVGSPRKYGHLGLPVIPDLYTGFGPLGAILTALRSTSVDWNLILACDMPSVHPDLFEALFKAARHSGPDCIVPSTRDGQVHPLCAVYHRKAGRALERSLQSGVLSVVEALQSVRTRFLPVQDDEWLRNVNTPADWPTDATEDQPDQHVAS